MIPLLGTEQFRTDFLRTCRELAIELPEPEKPNIPQRKRARKVVAKSNPKDGFPDRFVRLVKKPRDDDAMSSHDSWSESEPDQAMDEGSAEEGWHGEEANDGEEAMRSLAQRASARHDKALSCLLLRLDSPPKKRPNPPLPLALPIIKDLMSPSIEFLERADRHPPNVWACSP